MQPPQAPCRLKKKKTAKEARNKSDKTTKDKPTASENKTTKQESAAAEATPAPKRRGRKSKAQLAAEEAARQNNIPAQESAPAEPAPTPEKKKQDNQTNLTLLTTPQPIPPHPNAEAGSQKQRPLQNRIQPPRHHRKMLRNKRLLQRMS